MGQTDKTMDMNPDATATPTQAANTANARVMQPRATHADILRTLMTKHSATPDPAPAATAPRKMTAEKAASTAFSRAAERLYNLPTYPQTVTIKPISLAELSELLPEQALLAIIEGKAESLGVVALCTNTVGSLIEMQAIGRVSSRPVRPRKPTRTDAVITADFVSTLLQELGKEMKGRPGLPDFSSFSYASFMDDPRPMLLMLEDGPMTILSLRYNLGASGEREGQAIIALPSPSAILGDALPDDATALPYHMPQNPTEANLHKPATARSRRIETLAAAVQHAPVSLVGVLCRKTLSLAALRQLSPGDLISLPSGALDNATVETTSGQILALGRFGEADSYHAIRLRDPASENAKRSSSDMTHAAAQSGQDADHGLRDIDLSQPDDFRETAHIEAPASANHAELNHENTPSPIAVPQRVPAERIP